MSLTTKSPDRASRQAREHDPDQSAERGADPVDLLGTDSARSALMSAQYWGSAYSVGFRSLPLRPRPTRSGHITRRPDAARSAAR